MASQRSKRKRRAPSRTPRTTHAPRREQRVERQLTAERQRRAGQRMLGTVGERPEGLFGGVPVSELAILAGGIALVVGVAQGGGPPLYVGLIVPVFALLFFLLRRRFESARQARAARPPAP